MEILNSKHIAILCIIIGLSSCVRKANISLPTPEQKLVLTCFISPQDSLITASLRWSVPKYKPAANRNQAPVPLDITDATITLTDGRKTVTLPYDQNEELYLVDTSMFQIVAGRTYTINAKVPGGAEVTATTTVPVGTFAYEISNLNKFKSQFSDNVYQYNVSAIDRPGEINYVAIYVKQHVSYNGPFYQMDVSTQNLLFSDDETVNKSKYTATFEYYSSAPEDSLHIMEFTFQFLNCSRDFYKYNESVIRSSQQDGNPFSEPVLVYSNITNGFGCFGGFNKSSETRKVK